MGESRRGTRPDGFWSFVVVSCLAQVLLGWPFAELRHPAAAAAATAVFTATLLVALVGTRRSRPTLTHVAPAYLAIVVVVLWCYADGGSSSDFTVMYVLPVLWLALNGTVPQVWGAISAAAVAMIVPILAFHDDYYRLSDLRAAALVVAAACLIGPLARHISRERGSALALAAAAQPTRTHLEGILEASVEHALITTDVSGSIRVVNAGAERLLGWTAEQASGRPLDLLLTERVDEGRPPDPVVSVSAYESLTIPVLRGRSEAQTWWTHPQIGARVPLTVTASALRGPTGDLDGFVFLASAESDSRAALAALARQREIYRNLVQLLPSTVVGLLDRDLRWVSIGGQYVGPEVDDPRTLEGQELGTTLPTEVTRQLRAIALAAFEEDQHVELESHPGEWYEFDLSRMADEDGEARVLMVARDVTARHEIESERHRLLEAAVAGEELFRTIFESSPIGKILISHADGGPARFLGVNPAFARLVGVPLEELDDARVSDVVALDDHALILEMQTVRQSRVLEIRFCHASGRTIWCEVQCTHVTPGGGGEGFVIGQVIDVTDRKDAERALLDALERQRAAAESLREADALRTEVMSTVSHELRTPLTSITGYIELLVDGYGGPLEPRQREMLEVVDRNSRRLQGLVDDLLLLSRLDQGVGHEALAWEVVDLRDIIRRSVQTVRPLAEGRELTLSVSPGDRPVLVRGDAEQLDRALTNVLSNACKYTHPGGEVRVGLEVPDRESARLWVADTGVGIPAMEVGRLFTRFFRASSGGATGASGSGLGLAIVKSLVELHGGRVTVTSEPGIGSTFVLTLPLAKRALTVVDAT